MAKERLNGIQEAVSFSQFINYSHMQSTCSIFFC